MNKYNSIIFDLDGTLFQTDKLILPAFEKTFKQLVEEGYDIDYIPTKDDLLSVVGLTLDDIWQNLLPNLPAEAHLKANQYLLNNELGSIKEGYGALYPNVVEVLLELKNKGYRLFIASNGLEGYVKGIASAFRIDHLFEAMYSAGEFNTPTKNELVRILLADYNIPSAIMVGDRSSDVEAGIANDLYVIGCNFGFSSENELKKANIIIEQFEQILGIA